MKGLLVGVDPTTHTYYNYFPMPYGTSARVALVNSSGQTITNATGVTQYNPTAYSNLNTDSGYFVAQYNREAPTTTGRDFVWGQFPFRDEAHVVGSLLHDQQYRLSMGYWKVTSGFYQFIVLQPSNPWNRN